jgi:hypothetical protein
VSNARPFAKHALPVADDGCYVVWPSALDSRIAREVRERDDLVQVWTPPRFIRQLVLHVSDSQFSKT